MPHLGMGELIVIFLIVLLVFGAGRLPQIGEGVGKAIRGFKRGLQSDDEINVTPRSGDANKQLGDSSGSRASEPAERDAGARKS